MIDLTSLLENQGMPKIWCLLPDPILILIPLHGGKKIVRPKRTLFVDIEDSSYDLPLLNGNPISAKNTSFECV